MKPPTLSFEEHDQLNLAPFANQFEKFLLVEHHFADDALVVSLNAPFGSGKSTFLEMWRHDLEQRRKTDPQLPLPIYINAWESDYCGDPLVSILAEFTDVMNKLPKTPNNDKDSIKRGLKAIVAAAGNLGNQALKTLTSVDASEAFEKAREKWNPESAGEKLLADFKTKSEALESLKTELRTLFSGMEPKAIIMVDELDRCRPDFAIHYLETIKHIFSTKGLIFVLAVDHGQLAATARALFGQDLNFREYYRKFASRQVSLPEMAHEGCSIYLSYLEQRFLATPEGASYRRYYGLSNLSCFSDQIKELTLALKLTPRQMNEVFRVIGHATSLNRPSTTSLPWAKAAGLMLMVCLSVVGHPLYQGLRSNSLPLEEVFREIGGLMRGYDDSRYWVELTMTGAVTTRESFENLAQKIYPFYQKYNVRIHFENPVKLQEELKGILRGWRVGSWIDEKSYLSQLCQSIETAQRFLNG